MKVIVSVEYDNSEEFRYVCEMDIFGSMWVANWDVTGGRIENEV